MSDSETDWSRFLPWALRGIVVAGAVGVLLLDWYHRARPEATGIPIWAFPGIPVVVFAGPAALGLLAAETVLTLKRKTKIVPLFLDAGLVAAWLVFWFSHL